MESMEEENGCTEDDAQGKDKRQQTQTKDLPVKYGVKTLPTEHGDPAAVFTSASSSQAVFTSIT